MRILFTTVGLSGHFFPLVPLAWTARALGHEVLVAASADFVPTVLRSGLPAVRCGPAADFVELGAGEAADLDFVSRRQAHGRIFGRIAAGKLAGTAAVLDAWQPDLVVSERAEFAGPVTAGERGVPWAQLRWGLAELTEYRTCAAEVLGTVIPSPGLSLDPWPPSLRRSPAAGHQGMRFVPYDGESVIPAWTLGRRERPRVCLTLGTLQPRIGGSAEETVCLVTEELTRLGADVVVAVDEAVAAGWRRRPAAQHVGRLPLSGTLGACDAVVHHGGHGTTLTAFRAGCPQLVLPRFDDTFAAADAVVRSGCGLSLEPAETTPTAVAKSCLDLLHSVRFGERVVDLAAELAVQPALPEVLAALEGFAKSGTDR